MNKVNKTTLPSGWTWTSLEGCAEILDRQRVPINSRERAIRNEGKPESELIPYFGATGQVGWIDEHIFDEELVLLGEDGAPFLDAGKDIAYMIRGKSWVNNHAHVLRAFNSLTSNSYLLHYLNTFDFHDYVTGTTRLKLNQSRMKEIPIPIAPYPEQDRIVAEIEKQFTRLDQAVASLKRLQSNLARYKASVLKAACDGRLVPQDPNDEPAADLLARILAERRDQWEKQEWQSLIAKAQKKAAQAQRKTQGLPARIKDLQPDEWEAILEAEYARYLPKNDKWKEKYKEPAGVAADMTPTAVLPDLPKSWIWTSVAQLGGILGGLTKNAKREALPMKMPYLRVANVYANELNLEDVATIGIRETELKRVLLEDNDLLVVEGNGSIDQIGRVALWNGSISPCVHQNHLIKVRFLETGIADFVLYWLLSPEGRKSIQKVASSTSGLHTLSLSKVAALPVPVPPLTEQKRIVAEVERRLSVVTATEQAITANLARAERLRQSILGRAFSGQLVPQNVL